MGVKVLRVNKEKISVKMENLELKEMMRKNDFK